LTIPGLTIIGDRLDSGFKSSRALFENEDMAGLQALAKRQAEAGAAYLNINVGPKAHADPSYMKVVIEAVQAAVDLPLAFDFPSLEVQEVCLKSYDPERAGGRKPVINSIAETRMELLDLLKIRPAKVIMMASERVEDGVSRPNKTSADVHATAKRVAARLTAEHGLAPDDIFIDISISLLASDTEALTKMALDAVAAIGADADMRGVHIMGGLSNIAGQLPPKATDGSPLRSQLESAFLTLAVPRGFNTVLATPWKVYELLPEDNFVMKIFLEITELEGLDALRALRKLYT
jgi:cobalamin-dependent methionine synthase I